MTWSVKSGPRWAVGLQAAPLCVFQRRHGQQLIKRLPLAEAQAHGKVNWHRSGPGVATKGVEDSEDKNMIRLDLTQDGCTYIHAP